MKPIEMSAIELANAIKTKKISSREAVIAYVEQINKVNPIINAIVQINTARALQEAARLDNLLAKGELVGPLHGVPFAMKDVYNTEGDIVTAGTLSLNDNVAKTDCVIAQRLKKAGGILLGKTNTPELESGADTDNLIYGKTVNPYDITRSAGGSSGGSAAIVAAAGTAFAIGADCGGSLRMPAHYCGVATIRPTVGRIPTTGVVYGQRTGMGAAFTTEGPIARRVEDLELILKIISGPDGIDPKVVPMPLGSMHDLYICRFKVSYFDNDGNSVITLETKETLQAVVSELEKYGVKIEENKPKMIGDGYIIFPEMLGANGVNAFQSAFKMLKITQASSLVNKLMKFFEKYTCDLPTFMARWDKWDQFRSDILQFMQNYDAMICPVTPKPALPITETMLDPANINGASYCWEITASLLPSVVVRCGTSKEGLPIGLQIIANPWREDVSLAIAKVLESKLGGWKMPKNLASNQ